ncbi:MAG: undecaprenyl-diphosphate phosphatase [Candidatus Izemoplasmatales bacterium]|nr:undecaprenyl-diphosphate phosphatase [Candidatus Izemoplasmatales bacterium]
MDFDLLELIKYILLGIVQGVTEVLPISSSGHVELIKGIFNIDMDRNIFFLIVLNTGSLLAFIVIYFKKLFELAKSFFVFIFVPQKRAENKENFIYLMKVVVACIPAGIAGLLLGDYLENFIENYSLLVAGIGLLITATVIYFVSKLNFENNKAKVSWWDVLFIGLAQSAAIVPGISRSGMTTSTALKRDVDITHALNFSFLMYIFISIGALGKDLLSESITINNTEIIYYGFAFIAAIIFTYIAYKFIFNIFKSGKLNYFSYYCFGVGALAIFLFYAI